MSQSARQALARNLRQCRLLRGLSQEQLAERAGLDRSYVGGIERAERNPGLDTIAKLAAALELGIGELLGEPDWQKQAAAWRAAPGGQVREPAAAYTGRAWRRRGRFSSTLREPHSRPVVTPTGGPVVVSMVSS
jgi:transcriptional regulator with XRE-family HTH domain